MKADSLFKSRAFGVSVFGERETHATVPLCTKNLLMISKISNAAPYFVFANEPTSFLLKADGIFQVQ